LGGVQDDIGLDQKSEIASADTKIGNFSLGAIETQNLSELLTGVNLVHDFSKTASLVQDQANTTDPNGATFNGPAGSSSQTHSNNPAIGISDPSKNNGRFQPPH
jgi:hypothetical protein